MEFKIERQKFYEILSKIQGITLSKSNISILSNVLIKAIKEEIQVIVTDLDIDFTGVYPAEILKEGAVTIPSRKLFEIVKEFPHETIHIREMENRWIHIVDDIVEYNLVGMDIEDFPKVLDYNNRLIEIELEFFKEMINKTIFSVLVGEGYAEMTGVYLQQEENKIRMVSTDGHRLTLVEKNIDSQFNTDNSSGILQKGIIIPRRGLSETEKILVSRESGMSGEKLGIGVENNKIIFSIGKETISSRLIEGEFPDYQTVIPTNNCYNLFLPREPFLMVLKRMSIFSSEKYRGVKFKIKKESVEIININPELGESSEVIKVSYDGEPLEIGFNPRYFIDTLSHMNSQEVVINLNDNNSSCIIQGKDDIGFKSIIMPMVV